MSVEYNTVPIKGDAISAMESLGSDSEMILDEQSGEIRESLDSNDKDVMSIEEEEEEGEKMADDENPKGIYEDDDILEIDDEDEEVVDVDSYQMEDQVEIDNDEELLDFVEDEEDDLVVIDEKKVNKQINSHDNFGTEDQQKILNSSGEEVEGTPFEFKQQEQDITQVEPVHEVDVVLSNEIVKTEDKDDKIDIPESETSLDSIQQVENRSETEEFKSEINEKQQQELENDGVGEGDKVNPQLDHITENDPNKGNEEPDQDDRISVLIEDTTHETDKDEAKDVGITVFDKMKQNKSDETNKTNKAEEKGHESSEKQQHMVVTNSQKRDKVIIEDNDREGDEVDNVKEEDDNNNKIGSVEILKNKKTDEITDDDKNLEVVVLPSNATNEPLIVPLILETDHNRCFLTKPKVSSALTIEQIDQFPILFKDDSTIIIKNFDSLFHSIRETEELKEDFNSENELVLTVDLLDLTISEDNYYAGEVSVLDLIKLKVKYNTKNGILYNFDNLDKMALTLRLSCQKRFITQFNKLSAEKVQEVYDVDDDDDEKLEKQEIVTTPIEISDEEDILDEVDDERETDTKIDDDNNNNKRPITDISDDDDDDDMETENNNNVAKKASI